MQKNNSHEKEQHELIVIGGGPAGLAAAINAESEGLDTLVLEGSPRLGGQAGTSSLIENYPGFPDGISGPDLMFQMVDQAARFETEFLAPYRATDVSTTEDGIRVETDKHRSFIGGTVLLAMGVQNRPLDARNLPAWLGRGVEYGSPNLNENFEGQTIYVVGGANSAGQAVQHLRKFTDCKVHIVIRGDSLDAKMSEYLIEPLEEASNVEIHTNTIVTAVDGKSALETITLEEDGEEKIVQADRLLVMIGSQPNTLWLPDSVAKNDRGFVLTGGNIPEDDLSEFERTNGGRAPFGHESSIPGLFAAGDIRYGTIKRVASAVGDGSSTISEIHEFYSRLRETTNQ